MCVCVFFWVVCFSVFVEGGSFCFCYVDFGWLSFDLIFSEPGGSTVSSISGFRSLYSESLFWVFGEAFGVLSGQPFFDFVWLLRKAPRKKSREKRWQRSNGVRMKPRDGGKAKGFVPVASWKVFLHEFCSGGRKMFKFQDKFWGRSYYMTFLQKTHLLWWFLTFWPKKSRNSLSPTCPKGRWNETVFLLEPEPRPMLHEFFTDYFKDGAEKAKFLAAMKKFLVST